jgi:uncharacterized RDD family membrane protein YckC
MKACLVLMPFSEALRSRFELLAQCGRQLDLDVRRVDTYAYSGNIPTAIAKALSQADLVIGDLSDANPNVLYELAIAQCLGQRVVLITNDRNTIPFDLRAYRNELVVGTSAGESATLVGAMRQALNAPYVTGPLGGQVVFGQRVFWRRTAAFVIDLFVLALPLMALNLLLTGQWLPRFAFDLRELVCSVNPTDAAVQPTVDNPLGLLWVLIYFVYFVLTTWWMGASLGQWICDLRVATLDGDKPDASVALGRTVASALTVLFTYGVGFLWCLRGPGYRAFHDIMTRTMVIRRTGRPRLTPV